MKILLARFCMTLCWSCLTCVELYSPLGAVLYTGLCPDAGASEIRVILRMDDSGFARHTPPAQGDGLPESEVTRRVIEIVAKYNARITIGVIPNVVSGSPGYQSEDPEYALLSSCPEEVAVLKHGVEAGCVEIALHGYTHEVLTENNGHASEFGGRPYEEQYGRLAMGKKELEQALGFTVDTFIPPFNNHDNETLHALEELGFNAISSVAEEDDVAGDLHFVPYTTSLKYLRTAAMDAFSTDGPILINAFFHVYDFSESGSKTAYLSLAEFDEFLQKLTSDKNVRLTTISEEVQRNGENLRSADSRLYALYVRRVRSVMNIQKLLGPFGARLEAFTPPMEAVQASSRMRHLSNLLFWYQALAAFIVVALVGAFAYAALRLLLVCRSLRMVSPILLAASCVLLSFLLLEGMFGLVGAAGFGSRLVFATSTSAGLFLASLLNERRRRGIKGESRSSVEIRVLLRMDDSGYGRGRSEDHGSPSSEVKVTNRVAEIVAKHSAKLTIGVVPSIHDGHPWLPSYLPLSSCPEEINILRNWTNDGCVELAQHGCAHRSHQGQRSEFTGRSFEDQFLAIKKGKEELETALSMPIPFFIPPWNKHDHNTLLALERLGFTAISASQNDSANLDIVYIRATTDIANASGRVSEAIERELPALIVIVFHAWEFLESGSPMADVPLESLERLIDGICKCANVRFTTMGEEVVLARSKDYPVYSQSAYNTYHAQISRVSDLLSLLGPLRRCLHLVLSSPGVMYPKRDMEEGRVRFVLLELVINAGAFVLAFAISYAVSRICSNSWSPSILPALISNMVLVGVFLVSEGLFGLVGTRGFGSRLTIAIVSLLGFLTGIVLSAFG